MAYIHDLELQVSIVADDYDSSPDSDNDTASSATTTSPQVGCFTGSMVQRIEEGSNAYEIIKKIFVTGMRDLRNKIDVVGICRKIYTLDHVMASARYETFRAFSTAVANKNGGDSNAKFAWYGGTSDEISEILSFGFGLGRRSTRPQNQIYGQGVYLTPSSLPFESLPSLLDADGFGHLLLCRVILGKTEAICPGSHQYRPSSVEFDSGVDNLSSPTKYIIWESCLNTHILPVFVVSFKVDSSMCYTNVRIPKSPHLSISKLLKLLEDHLAASKVALLSKQHRKFLENKITRLELVRSFRAIAGDEVLRAAVRVHGPKEKMEAMSRSVGA